MEEVIVQLKVNGRVKRKTVLSREDVGLLFSGLGYARERDYLDRRKEGYKILIKKLREVLW